MIGIVVFRYSHGNIANFTTTSIRTRINTAILFVSVSLCSGFNLNNKNVNALVASQLSGFTCTRSLTMNFSFIVSERVQVYLDNSLAECVNLQINAPALFKT